jgi:hypothetical protein
MLSSLRIGDLTSVLPVPKIPVVPAALITGGTSGIGLAIARALREDWLRSDDLIAAAGEGASRQ